MPLPSVQKGESRRDFISRCMDDSVISKEFQKSSQRFAVCNSIYEKNRTTEIETELNKFTEE